MNAALLLLTLLAATDAPPMSAVYSRYPSGRPQLVVKATRSPDELLLLRYADVRGARPRVISRDELDDHPVEVSLEKIIDAKDVVVEILVHHGTSRIVDRVAGDRLVRIADDYGELLDFRGVPAIISGAYAGRNQCGVVTAAFISRWNGKRFVNDGHRYVAYLAPGAGAEDDEILLSAAKRYVLHLHGRGRVTLDDEPLEPGKPFRTEEDCHTIALRDAGAKTRAWLEELP